MTTDFHVAGRRYGPMVHLSPRGDLDIDTAPRFEACVEGLIHERARMLVVDLAGVDFIDSSGLRALLVCKSDAEKAGACLQVRQVRPFQRRILEITGLDEVFEVADDHRRDRHRVG